MAAGITVTLEGGEALIEALRRLEADIVGALGAAGAAGAVPVVDAANSRAPGPHIEAEVVGVSEKRVTVKIGPDKEHWYYRFAETGAAAHEIAGPLVFEGREGLMRTASAHHPGMAAQPFLRPARDEKQGAASDAMGASLRAQVAALR